MFTAWNSPLSPNDLFAKQMKNLIKLYLFKFVFFYVFFTYYVPWYHNQREKNMWRILNSQIKLQIILGFSFCENCQLLSKLHLNMTLLLFRKNTFFPSMLHISVILWFFQKHHSSTSRKGILFIKWCQKLRSNAEYLKIPYSYSVSFYFWTSGNVTHMMTTSFPLRTTPASSLLVIRLGTDSPLWLIDFLIKTITQRYFYQNDRKRICISSIIM